MWLFLAFLAVPLIEIALFIQVGGVIGLWPTLAIVVMTAVAGTYLVRSQGLAALARLRSAMERLDDPVEPLADGAMILVAGVLLLTPGFFTDAVGFALLVPAVRQHVFRFVADRARMAMHARNDGNSRQPAPSSEVIIEGDFVDLDPKDIEDSDASGWTKH